MAPHWPRSRCHGANPWAVWPRFCRRLERAGFTRLGSWAVEDRGWSDSSNPDEYPYVWLYIYIYTYIHNNTANNTDSIIHTHLHLHLHLHLHTLNPSIHPSVRPYVRTYVHTYLCVYIYINTHTHIYIYTHTHIYIYRCKKIPHGVKKFGLKPRLRKSRYWTGITCWQWVMIQKERSSKSHDGGNSIKNGIYIISVSLMLVVIITGIL